MKLQRLHIKKFRNIEDLDLDLSKQDGLSILIGNNGTGKSNILEATIAIFAGLYSRSRKFMPLFDYDIEYKMQDETIKISKSGEKLFLNGDEVNKKDLSHIVLPKNVIACYSGETLRLQENYFKPFRKRYVRNILHNRTEINNLRLLLINKDMWDISLLVLFLHDFEIFTEIKGFCQDLLNLKSITSITFELSPKHLTKENSTKQLIDAISPNGATSVTISIDRLKKIIEKLGIEAKKEVFMALYVGYYSHGIQNISIQLKSNDDNLFEASLLSEGEKKLLSIFTMLEVLADENSLMIYDEPDSQIHISRKGEIKTLVEKYNNRQHLITTHSPTLVSAFFDSSEHLNCLSTGQKGYTVKIDADKCSLIAKLTDGLWNISDQNIFLASNKPITLLVEGKTDKIHIEEAFKRLKNDYTDLQFDIFYFNGANNIPQFMTGLKTCEIDLSNRCIIAIFDNDTEGRDCCNQTQVKYTKNQKNKASLYAITLPIKSDGTIENLYAPSKYDAAFKSAVEQHSFKGLVSSYAEAITTKAKIELSNNVKNFVLEDFENFRPLFDVIREIKQL